MPAGGYGSVRNPLRPPLPYFGGKTRLAPWIVSLLPEHRVYVEPFAGSCAVLLAKPRSSHELVNDIWGDLVTFLRVLRDDTDALVDACQLTPYARDEFYACEQRPADISDLERARRLWVRIVQAFAAATADSHRLSWSCSVANRQSDAVTAQVLVDRMREVGRRLASVIIENRPAIDIIERFGRDDDAVIYADPPYFVATRTSANDYQHDYAREDDHRALADALHRARAAVLISGYHSPLYDELYGDWERAERTTRVNSSNRRGSNPRQAVEVVWSNRTLRKPSLLLFEDVV
jgi:DNA adenine methylase